MLNSYFNKLNTDPNFGFNFTETDFDTANNAPEARNFIQKENIFNPEINLNKFLAQILNSTTLSSANRKTLLGLFKNSTENLDISPKDSINLILTDFENNKISTLLLRLCELINAKIPDFNELKDFSKATFDRSKLTTEILQLVVTDKALRKNFSQLIILAQSGVINQNDVLEIFEKENLTIIKENQSEAISLPIGGSYFYPICAKENSNPLDKLNINTGPCLFGVTDAQAIVINNDKQKSIVTLVDSKVPIDGQIVDLVFNPNPHYSELESFERFA
jgi:hypothetical protein